jgi:protein-S-isoprenylcysteine O-methyltransferase Ste14
MPIANSPYWAILLACCWGAVGLTWLVGWIYLVRKGPKVEKKSPSRSLWVWRIGLIVLIAVTALVPAGFWMRLEYASFWSRILGSICLLASTIFTLWARLALGSMWSRVAEVKVSHQLRTHGPYGITRHPIYTGFIGMLLGSLILEGFGIVIVYFLYVSIVIASKIPSEERIMRETFGEQYFEYQKRVPKLVPGFQFLPGKRKK